MNHKNLKSGLAALALGMCAASAQATLVTYAGFGNTTGLTLVGNTGTAATGDGTVLRLTPAAAFASGAAYSDTAITLGANATFSTTFQFRITNPGGIDPADGFTFVLSKATAGLGAPGGGLGYQGVANSVAIEFDTFNNGGGDNSSSNHVGINTNGSVNSSNISSPYGKVTCDFGGGTPYTASGCMSNGHLWTAKISYNGSLLSAVLQDESEGSTFTALSNVAIDIGAILGTNDAFVGFTSGTGSGFANHDIINWQFANDLQLANDVPEPGSLALLGLALGGLGLYRRKRA